MLEFKLDKVSFAREKIFHARKRYKLDHKQDKMCLCVTRRTNSLTGVTGHCGSGGGGSQPAGNDGAGE